MKISIYHQSLQCLETFEKRLKETFVKEKEVRDELIDKIKQVEEKTIENNLMLQQILIFSSFDEHSVHQLRSNEQARKN